MKLLIASDLHGSAYYCRKLLDFFHTQHADRLLLLGDLLYHGPRNPLPKEYDTQAVAAMLNGISDRLLCVRGNCDADVDQLVLDFPVLADNAFLSVNEQTLFATHGHTYGPENPPPLHAGDYLLCGHIHLPVCRALGEITYLNPGSVSLPKDGTPHSCMMLDGDRFLWFDLETGSTFEPLP